MLWRHVNTIYLSLQICRRQRVGRIAVPKPAVPGVSVPWKTVRLLASRFFEHQDGAVGTVGRAGLEA